MTDDELLREMKRLSTTIPPWMRNASAQAVQTWKGHVAKAAGLSIKGRKRWRRDAEGVLRDFYALEDEVCHVRSERIY